MFRAIATVGGWTMVSRILGFCRDVLIAAYLGAGPMADAFFVALKLPNLFRRLFGEGAFNAAFVPAFAAALTRQGPAVARQLAERLASLMALWLSLLCGLGIFFMPQLLTVLAPGFPARGPGQMELAVELTRIVFPYLVFICLTALVSGVLNAMGRLYMEPLDSPFRAVAELLARFKLGASVQAIVADFHAEATSETMAFGHSFDGAVSLVVGTHTHVPTADHTILPGGTAYQTDAGMCGDYDSVIGMSKLNSGTRFWSQVPGERMSPADGEATLCGVFVVTDDRTGLAVGVQPLRQGGRLSQIQPDI